MKLGVVTAEPNNFVPLKLKEEAEKLGMEVEILDVAKIVHLECAEPKILYDGKPLELDVVIPRLNEHQLEVKLALLRRMELSGIKMVNTADSMALCNDKLESQIKLQTQGIVVPWSAIVHDPEHLETALAAAEEAGKKFPMILKTLRGTHGIGVMKVDSKSSLVSVFQAVHGEGQQLMIQEFIEHDSSYRIIMIGQELLAANERGQPKEKEEFRTNSHLGSETKKYDPSEEELEFSKKIVAEWGCNFCAIDYIKLEDGTFLVLEVNSSPGLEAMQKNWEDKNLPEHVVKFAQSLVEGVAAVDPGNDAPPPVGEPEAAQGPVVSDVMPVLISRLMTDAVDARIDTGAGLSALHVNNMKLMNDETWVHFTRNDVGYKVPVDRMIQIKDLENKDNNERRPVVLLDVTIAGEVLHRMEFTLTSRDNRAYEILIGRNVLSALGLPIVIPSSTDVPNQEGEAVVLPGDTPTTTGEKQPGEEE